MKRSNVTPFPDGGCMNCEIFFEINGSGAEKAAVCRRIQRFLASLEELGDICNLDGSPEILVKDIGPTGQSAE